MADIDTILEMHQQVHLSKTGKVKKVDSTPKPRRMKKKTMMDRYKEPTVDPYLDIETSLAPYTNPKVMIPIRTTYRVQLLDGLSNVNYQKEVQGKIVNPPQALKGGVLTGSHRVYALQPNRMYIQFNELVLPNGKTYPIKANVFDRSDGQDGIKAEVDDRLVDNILKTISSAAKEAVAIVSATRLGSVDVRGITDRVIDTASQDLETNRLVSLDKGRIVGMTLLSALEVEITYEQY